MLVAGSGVPYEHPPIPLPKLRGGCSPTPSRQPHTPRPSLLAARRTKRSQKLAERCASARRGRRGAALRWGPSPTGRFVNGRARRTGFGDFEKALRGRQGILIVKLLMWPAWSRHILRGPSGAARTPAARSQ